MAERQERCDRCRWWDGEGHEDEHADDRPGWCRRYPPVLHHVGVAESLQVELDYQTKTTKEDIANELPYDQRFWHWPVTTASDWCGEFRPRDPRLSGGAGLT